MPVPKKDTYRLIEVAQNVCDRAAADDAMNNVVSLDSIEGDGFGKGYAESPESKLDIMEVESMVLKLPERERKIIFLRYYRDMTQQQVAGCMGISQVQVSRLEKKAIAKIRENMVE